MTPIATVEREAKLEGKNMFMILAPRPVPTGPPKFTHPHHDEPPAALAAASEAIDKAAGIHDDDESDDVDTQPSRSKRKPIRRTIRLRIGVTQGVASRA